MYAFKDLMWWRIWKILQNFLETKQGLNWFFKENLHHEASIQPRLPRTRHSSREPTTTPPVRQRHQPQPPPGALRLGRINPVGLPPSARRIRHLNTACALPVRRPIGAEAFTDLFASEERPPGIRHPLLFPVCCAKSSSQTQAIWLLVAY